VRTGASRDNVAKLIEGAIKANPAALGPRAALFDLHLTAGDTAAPSVHQSMEADPQSLLPSAQALRWRCAQVSRPRDLRLHD